MTEVVRRPSLARALIGVAEALRYQRILVTGRSDIENDPWHLVGGVGEVPYDVSNGWQTPANGSTLSFRLIPDGFIVFRGYALRSPGPPPNEDEIIFTLPTTHLPYEIEDQTCLLAQASEVTDGIRTFSKQYGGVARFRPTGTVRIHEQEYDANFNATEDFTVFFDGLIVWAGPL